MSTKVTSPDELPQKPGIYIMKDKNGIVLSLIFKRTSTGQKPRF